MSDDPQPIYGVRDGWIVSTEPPVEYDNPNRAWYNALWQPRKIWMQRMWKRVGGETYVKWSSITGFSLVEWSEDDVAEG